MKSRFYFWCGLAAAGFCLVTLGLVYRAARSSPTSEAKAVTGPGPSQNAEGRGLASSRTTAPEHGALGSRSSKHPWGQNSSAQTPEEATSEARELVARLTQLDVSKGPITPQDAEKWKQALSDLVSYGPAAVPAIREFLQKNEDVDFRQVRGGALLGQPSIRTALICTLQEIGGAEARDLMVETMAATAVPSEIALVGNYLEQQAPGQYRQQALNAAGEAMTMAVQGQLPGMDIGPLLEMMRNFDATTVGATVEKLAPEYKIYATIALAGLQDGAGLPALVRAMQDSEDGARSQLAYQMLAQISAQSPDASAALMQLARQGQIPDSAWPKIALGLGGDQFGMFSFSADGKPEIPSLPGLKLYHVDSGNQNFYSVPVSALVTPEQADQRRQLIDQLLATNPGSAAVQALKQARTRLSGGLASN